MKGRIFMLGLFVMLVAALAFLFHDTFSYKPDGNALIRGQGPGGIKFTNALKNINVDQSKVNLEHKPPLCVRAFFLFSDSGQSYTDTSSVVNFKRWASENFKQYLTGGLYFSRLDESWYHPSMMDFYYQSFLWIAPILGSIGIWAFFRKPLPRKLRTKKTKH